jgi:hypothetical protein
VSHRPALLVVLALAFALPLGGCPPSYDLPRTAASVPGGRAVVLGLVPQNGKEFWYARLERNGAELEIEVPRSKAGVFAWSLPPGEYRVLGLRRTVLDSGPSGGGGPSSGLASDSFFPAGDTPWFDLVAGEVYCVGTLAADVEHRKFLGSEKGAVRYDARCDFDFLDPDDRPASRWGRFPWAAAAPKPVPVVAPH